MSRADQRKFHYIYKITRADGKYYIGMHSTDDLEDGYFGSGQLLWKSIKKHGKEKHTKEILEFLPSRSALKERERELVSEDIVNDTYCMNLSIGGGGSWGHLQGSQSNDKERSKKISEAQKQRLANGGANRWGGEAGSKLSTTKNLERAANGTNPWAGDLGSKHAKAVCDKQIAEGRHPFQQQKVKDKVSERCRQQIMAGSHPFQNLEKITCCYCGKIGSSPNMRRWHFDNCKKK